MNRTVRIGTRGSRLALWQAEAVRNALVGTSGVTPDSVLVTPIRTTGDVITDRPLSEAGGKGLFTKEIEAALLSGAATIAVHSAKDMETVLPPGLIVGAVLPREDVRDALIARGATSLATLRKGARVGTASLRRAALIRRARPDVETALLRGNVPTRLRRVESGEFDATLLAAAGLNRLGLSTHITALLPLETFPPACGQGIIAIECREDDAATRDLLSAIDDPESGAALRCERAFLRVLDGSCRTSVAGHARIESGRLVFNGILLAEDGSESYEAGGAGDPADAAEIGAEAGRTIRSLAPRAFLERLGIA
jgi:hydroxymethylbilane synthase